MEVRKIIDKRQSRNAVDRALRANTKGADFLLKRIMEDTADRLSVTKRTFSGARIVSPWHEQSLTALTTIANVSAFEPLQQSIAQHDGDLVGLENASVDLVLDVAALHQANDIPGTLIQYRRALKEDGLFLACVPGGDTLHELRQSLLAAETEVSGGIHPRILPFMDVRDAGGLLQRAGFALPVTDVEAVTVRYDTMFDLMFDLRAMGATNTLSDRKKSFTSRSVFHHAARHYADNYADADGRIRATFSFIWMSGWAPSSTQQKPLKPGSATHSLADALKDKSTKQ